DALDHRVLARRRPSRDRVVVRVRTVWRSPYRSQTPPVGMDLWRRTWLHHAPMGTLSPGDQPLDVTRFDVESASDLLGTWVRRTPVVALERNAFGATGRLSLKLELLQHTGSFKPR